MGMSQVQPNEILTKENMLKLPCRTLCKWKCYLFSFCSNTLPWGNYRSKFPCITKNHQGCFLAQLHSENWGISQQIEEPSQDKEGGITQCVWLSQDACLFFDQKIKKLKARSRIKASFPRGNELVSKVAGLSVLWINGVSLDIFLLAETEHPWGKDTDLTFVYSIGGDVLPDFDKCV